MLSLTARHLGGLVTAPKTYLFSVPLHFAAVNREVTAIEIEIKGSLRKVKRHELKSRMSHLSILLKIKCRSLIEGCWHITGLSARHNVFLSNSKLPRNMSQTARLYLDFNVISVHWGGQDYLFGGYCVWFEKKLGEFLFCFTEWK